MKKLKALLLSMLALSVVGGIAACDKTGDSTSDGGGNSVVTPAAKEYKVTVTMPNGTPAADITLNFCVGENCQPVKTDANGVAVLPFEDDATVYHVEYKLPIASMYENAGTAYTEFYTVPGTLEYTMQLNAYVKPAKEILEAAYALTGNATIDATLTGVVTSVERTGEGEACLTFVVDGFDQYPLYCFWLKGDEAGNLKVGYTITVTGTIKKYNDTVEFDHPTLDSFVVGEPPKVDVTLSDASVVIPAAYALASGATMEGTHTLKGQVISSDKNGYTIVVAGYEKYPIYCYKLQNASADISLGDYLTVSGTIKNYNGTVEFDKPTLLEREEGTLVPSIDVTPSAGTGIAEGYQVITVEQALAIAAVNQEETTERYYIHATVSTILDYKFGEMVIADDTGSIPVYGTYSNDGSLTYPEMTEKAYKGDEVLLSCTLNTHSGTLQVRNARLIAFESVTFDDSDYTTYSIDDARELNAGDKAKVSGVVAQITYANGMVPNGVYLVDNENSIYVFSTDIAGRVAVGNTITVAAEKAWWILETETANAEKFGYKGCNQLDNAWLIANDNGNTEPNYSWVEETTVKAIMDTPITEDITTTIYKVNALVKKSVGADFINYYIDDLDGVTGSYVYTQCNGNDLTWLEAFDGKICTVYLSAINAKSTASGCTWRFKAIKVIDEGFTFDAANAPQFAIDYYGAEQFAPAYTADPALELVTSVSSELLGFEGVTLTYASDNTSIIYFDNGVMHTGAEYGTANVTITATLNGVTATKVIAISHEKAPEIPSITVAEAITTAVGTEITVKGIVGPSLINKQGIYLFGEDGSMIAVQAKDSAAFFEKLSVGNEIIIKGTRDRKVNEENMASRFGQSNIFNAEILQNNYGTHEYPTTKFVTDKTIAQVKALDITTDYTTTVFVVSGKLNVPTSGNNDPSITQGDDFIAFYKGSATQYAWLASYSGQDVTLEIALCNWNNKTEWKCCVLAIRLADGTKVINEFNFKK